jgi:aerobic carbon-monoxide dehydrogenase small subunit
VNERERIPVSVTVNGTGREAEVEGRVLLVDFLREELGLTGTHSACDDGVCGACTVLADGQPVKSCLMLAAQVDGGDVTTVEGIGAPQSLHPVQQAFVDAGAVQCGYCTPGMVVATAALLARNPDPDDEAIRAGLVGNVCRCGGYQAIRDAVRLAARELANGP